MGREKVSDIIDSHLPPTIFCPTTYPKSFLINSFHIPLLFVYKLKAVKESELEMYLCQIFSLPTLRTLTLPQRVHNYVVFRVLILEGSK